MTEEVPQGMNRNVIIALVVVAALLAAVVGVLIWQSTKSDDAATTPAGTTDTGSGTGNGTGTGTGSTVPFDPATATKVPAGTEPAAFVTAYYKACAAGDFANAWKMLPTSTKKDKYADSVDGYTQQLKGYGDLSNYTVAQPKENGEEVVVTGTQTIQGMPFAYDWTFVKGDDGNWLVKSREQAGM